MENAKIEKQRHETYEKVKKDIIDDDEIMRAFKTVTVECPEHKKACIYE